MTMYASFIGRENTVGPWMMFHYTVDEMPMTLTLVCINEPTVKLVLLSVVSLKATEATDNVKWGLTVLWLQRCHHWPRVFIKGLYCFTDGGVNKQLRLLDPTLLTGLGTHGQALVPPWAPPACTPLPAWSSSLGFSSLTRSVSAQLLVGDINGAEQYMPTVALKSEGKE